MIPIPHPTGGRRPPINHLGCPIHDGSIVMSGSPPPMPTHIAHESPQDTPSHKHLQPQKPLFPIPVFDILTVYFDIAYLSDMFT